MCKESCVDGYLLFRSVKDCMFGLVDVFDMKAFLTVRKDISRLKNENVLFNCDDNLGLSYIVKPRLFVTKIGLSYTYVGGRDLILFRDGMRYNIGGLYAPILDKGVLYLLNLEIGRGYEFTSFLSENKKQGVPCTREKFLKSLVL